MKCEYLYLNWDIWISKLNTYICTSIWDICISIRGICIYDWNRDIPFHSTYGKLIPTSLADFYMRTVHQLQIHTRTNMMDGAVRPITDDTKKFIEDAQDFTLLSLYSHIHRYKHSHIFCYKQTYYINSIRIGRHLCCAKRLLENSTFSARFLRLVGLWLGNFLFRDYYYRARDFHRFLLASRFMYWMGRKTCSTRISFFRT